MKEVEESMDAILNFFGREQNITAVFQRYNPRSLICIHTLSLLRYEIPSSFPPGAP